MSDGVPDPGEEVDDPLFRAELDRAERAYQQRDWADARDRFLGLLSGPVLGRLLANRPLRPDDFVVCDRAASLCLLFRLPQAANECLLAIEDLQLSAGRRFAAEFAAVRRAAVLVGAGNLGAAEQVLDGRLRARFGALHSIPDDLAAWESEHAWPDADRATRSVLYVGYYYAAGRWFVCRGKYGRAVALLERGVRWAAPPSAALACRARTHLRLSLIGARIEQGNFSQADTDFHSLRNDVPGTLDLALGAELLSEEGRLALFRGQYGRALGALQRASAVYRSERLVVALCDALLNEAELLVLLNQVIPAKELLREVKGLASDPDTSARAEWIEGLAADRLGLPLGTRIAPSVTQLQVSDDPVAAPVCAASPGGTFWLSSYLAQFDRGATAVRQMVGRASPNRLDAALDELTTWTWGTDSALVAARARALAAEVAFHNRRPTAWEQLGAAVRELDTLELAPEAYQAVRYRALCAESLGQQRAECDALGTDAGRRLTALTRSLSPEHVRTYLLNKWTVEEHAVAVEARAVQDERDRVASAPWHLRWWRRAQFWHRLDDFLARLDGFKRDRPRETPIRSGGVGSFWGTVRAVWRRFRQARDRATVAYLVFPDRVFFSTSTRGRLDCRTLRLTRVGARSLVRAWHEEAAAWFAADANDDVGQCAADARAARVAGAVGRRIGLAAVLRTLPTRVTRLTIVPDDALHGVPFAALPHRSGHLIDRFAVSVTHECAPVPRRYPAAHDTRPLVAGVSAPVCAASRDDRFFGGALRFARTEALWIDRNMRRFGALDPIVLVDAVATKEGVLGALAGAGLVHIACHGVFRPDAPGESGLLLLADVPSADTNAAILSVSELVDRTFPRLQHVTLSSCWGADSFVAPGRWVISLPETLCRCGAGSVLANLWRVDDAMGFYFMTRFYDHARTLPRDEAVRLAQRDVRDRLLTRTRHRRAYTAVSPFLWAGFQLYGDPARIRL